MVAGALKAVELAAAGNELRHRLRENMRLFRDGLEQAGFELLPGEHPIIPVMLHDARRAAALAEALLARGVYVIAFSYPVVPKGRARIRCQISATHTRQELERAVRAFADAKAEVMSAA
jgi:glycine C-acetyltransferase